MTTCNGSLCRQAANPDWLRPADSAAVAGTNADADAAAAAVACVQNPATAEPVLWDNRAIAAQRIAASRIGVSVQVYRLQRAAGNRWCTLHEAWLPESEFYSPKTSYCRPCWNVYQRNHRRGGVTYVDVEATS